MELAGFVTSRLQSKCGVLEVARGHGVWIRPDTQVAGGMEEPQKSPLALKYLSRQDTMGPEFPPLVIFQLNDSIKLLLKWKE